MDDLDALIDRFLVQTDLDTADLHRSRSLVDNGLSSFSIMRFLMSLEDHLSVELSEDQLAEIVNGPVSAIADTVRRAVAGD
jgi:acyl carrier protein